MINRAADLFSTLVLDQVGESVRFGPAANGRWVEIADWGEQEWDVLLAIASHPRGVSERDIARRASQQVVPTRKVVFRIRERFRKHPDIPRQLADEVIVTRRSKSTFALSPRIAARVLPGRVLGAAAVGEPRALDSLLHATMRAVAEVFDQAGLEQTISLLPNDVRTDTVDVRHPPGRWVPVRYITAWMRAVWAGPAGHADEPFALFMRHVQQHRVSPYFIEYLKCQNYRLSDIQEMWRTCYDSGDFKAWQGPNDEFLDLWLANHPYCESERSRQVFALGWRELARVFGARDPRIDICEFNELTGTLHIRIGGVFVKCK